MGATIRRPLVRALFLFLPLFVSVSAFATDPVPTTPTTPLKTCATGQYLNQFNECADWCQKPYYGGASFFGGELIPARVCVKPGGVTIAGEQGGDDRPACWQYIGSLKDEYFSAGMKVQAYSTYTNPRDVCGSPGVKECGKLGCDRVEGGTMPEGISANGAPSPVFSGNNTTQISTAQQCTYNPSTGGYTNCQQVAGGTVLGNTQSSYAGTSAATAGASGVSDEFCERYGYSYAGMCSYDAARMKLVGTSAPPQQANENSVKYFPSPDDVGCNWTYNTSTKQYNILSGTCRGYFIPPYDPAAHTQACKYTANAVYSGPNREGYNPGSVSAYKACFLSNQYDRQRPKVNATWTQNPGYSPYVEMNYEWYSCEYINTKSSSSLQYQYKGTGAACSQLGALSGDTASNGPPYEYRSAPDDYMCENGKPREGWASAKCNGTYVPIGTPEREAQLFFGGAADGYIRFKDGTTEVVAGVNAGNTYQMPSGYTYNPGLLQGDPSVGTAGGPAYAGAPSSSGGGGLGALTSDTEMPSEQMDPWYTPVYENGPKGVWETRVSAVKSSRVAQWAKGFEIVGGGGWSPSWTLNLGQFGTHELSIPPAVMAALRYLVLISAALLARKLIFGG